MAIFAPVKAPALGIDGPRLPEPRFRRRGRLGLILGGAAALALIPLVVWATASGRPIALLASGVAILALTALNLVALYWNERDRAEIRRARTRIEGRLHRFSESGIIGMVSALLSGEITDANEEFLRIVGYTREEFRRLKPSWIDLTPPEWLAADERGMAEARSQGSCRPYEKQYVRKDGTRVDVLIGYVLLDATRDEEEVVAFALDITKRKRAEGRFDRLAEASTFGLMIGDIEGRVTYANPAILELLGFTDRDIEAERLRWDALTPPEYRDRDLKAVRELTATGTCTPYEKQYLARDGRRVPVLVGASVIEDVGGVLSVAAFITDLTEKNRAEASIREGKARLQAIFDSASVGIALTDPSGRFLEANRAYAAITGREVPELLTSSVQEITHPEDLPSKLALLRDLLDGRTSGFVVEKRYVRPSGESIWVRNSVSPIRDEAGRPVNLVILTQDTTASKAAEEELRNSELRYRTLTEGLPALVWTTRPDGSCDYLSRQWIEYTGIPASEQLGWNWLTQVIHPEDRQRTLEVWNAAIRGEGTYEPEYRLRGRDGSYRWFKARGIPIRDVEGEIVHWFGTCTDVDDAVRSKEAIEDGQERLRFALDTARLGSWEMDLKTGCFTCTDACKGNFGRPAGADFSYQDLFDAIVPEDRDRVRRRVQGSITGHDDYEAEFRITWPDGSPHWILARGRAFHEPDGTASRLVGLNLDITDRRAAEEALREADRRKDEFLAMLAHELRNPLSAIAGTLQAQEDDDPEGVASAREVIGRQVGHLAHLIDDLLDVSRISRGKIQLRREPLDLREVVNRAAAAAQPLMAGKRHRLEVAIDPGPMPSLVDPTRVEQVLSNLLTNAAKYTDDGGLVRLSARVQGGEAILTVEDNGVGISPEMLPRVFDLFTQVDRSLERSQGGLGIGLTLVRQLVEMHGGIVAVDSREGDGSRFTVRLPLLAGSDSLFTTRRAPDDIDPAAARSLRILVVDDNLDTARGMVRVLTRAGHTVRAAHDGLEGVAVAREFEPEVVLLDIGLPKMDGFEVARRLRNEPIRDDLRLIAISGYGQDSDRERSREAGFDHHLIKPVDFDVLFRLLKERAASPRTA